MITTRILEGWALSRPINQRDDNAVVPGDQLFAGFFAFASVAHSSAHFRQASAQRANASIFGCFSRAPANSSHDCAQTAQIGYAYFDPRSSSWVARVAIRAV